MRFPDWTPFLVNAPQSERDFAAAEFSHGLAYYRNRLERIGFSGKRVLDAGCGMGQYSAALAYDFERVDGIDWKTNRLDVAAKLCAAMGLDNVEFRQGSVEALPYTDGIFDAVFCYGVIMFTDMMQTINEFHRVLAPEGKLYVCLNGDGWNWKMLDERCEGNPTLRRDFEKALYTSLVQRYMPSLQRIAAEPSSRALLIALRHMEKVELSPQTLANALGAIMQLRLPELVESVEKISPEFRGILLADFFTFLLQGRWPTRLLGKTRGYLPEDVEPLLEAAGFCHWAWASEAQLYCLESLSEATPRYEGMYGGYPAVWEFVARKPDSGLTERAARINDEALAARKPVFCPPLKKPMVYSFTETFPLALARQLEEDALSLGGEAFFARQMNKLAAIAANDVDLLMQIIFFVQKSLYRHPVIQPSTRRGNLSPLAVLLSGIGRCGHAAALVCGLLMPAQIPCRIRTLRRHIIAEAFVGGRWVIADADAFKHGIIPRNRVGEMLSLDDLAAEPWRIDHFPATGWCCPSTAPQACTPLGFPVGGYVTSGSWSKRGYLSNYYGQGPLGYPPSQPECIDARREGGKISLRWTPSTCADEPVLHYAVYAGTASRGWTEADPNMLVTQPCPQDICCLKTQKTTCAFDAPDTPIFVNITAVGQRFEQDGDIFYWPGDESRIAK